jgi:Tfp pilus assembly protein PilF
MGGFGRLVFFCCVVAVAQERSFELAGSTGVSGRASVTVFGATSPFQVAGLTDEGGRFSFKKLRAGAYTVSVFLPARGEARKTVEVGAGTADSHGRVRIELGLKEDDFEYQDASKRQHAVSANELTIPEKALREYEDAGRELAKHDAGAATEHLAKALEMAPQFAAAWNEMGTIAYQTHRYERAEECFREALRADETMFEPLVNLGGVLLTLNKLDEAWRYNGYAVLARPNDALANSQMGMTYFAMGNYGLAEKHLEKARQADPAHFSHPQLVLAEIYLRRGERDKAAAAMEDFLAHHPDWPRAAKMRETIAELRQQK